MIKTSVTRNPWTKTDKLLGMGLIVVVFSLIFVTCHRAIFDLDIWTHLKTGEIILHEKYIPATDIFSFTRLGEHWPSHRWLFQVLVYFVFTKWQAQGLILLQCYITVLSFFILFLIGRSLTQSYLEIGIFIFLTAYASITRFNIRPEIFSLLFFGLYLYFLRFYLDKKRIWFLIPIQILWVNFHIYFILGPALVFLFILSEVLRRKAKFLPSMWREGFALSDAAFKRLLKLFIFTSLASLLNQGGIQGALYPFVVFKEILTGESAIFCKYIQELQPTFNVIKKLGNFYYILIFACFSLMAINYRRLKIVEILLAVSFFWFGLTVRNVSFFAFVAYLIIISYISSTIDKTSSNIKIEIPFRKLFYICLRFGLGIFLILWMGFKIRVLANQGYFDFEAKEFKSSLSGMDKRRFPEKAVDFILANGVPKSMLNDFNSGSYLIGRGYPQRKVFIDGRTEVYGAAFFNDYQKTMDGDISLFEKTVEKYDISAVLLTTISSYIPSIVSHIYKSPQWKLVFFDELAVVFLKDAPANQPLITRYKIDLKKYSAPAADLKALGIKRVNPEPYIKRASLLWLLGEYDAVISESKEALRILPTSFEAYQFIGRAYLKKKLYLEAFENLRSAALIYRNAEVLTDLGLCLKEMKENRYAITTLKSALKLNKDYAPAYYQLGTVYLSLKDEDKARKELEKALKLSGQNKDLHKEIEEKLKLISKNSKN